LRSENNLFSFNSPTFVISKIPFLGKIILSLINGPSWPENVEYGDILKGIKIKENSCDLVFASHVLEHLSYSDFHTSLNNIYKYLKPGGIFRFIVPDLKKYVDNYLVQYSDINIASKASVNFMKNTCTGCSNSRSSLYNRLREAFANSRHQWMWDEPSLMNAVNKLNFKNVRKCSYGDWLDNRFSLVEDVGRYTDAIGIQALK